MNDASSPKRNHPRADSGTEPESELEKLRQDLAKATADAQGLGRTLRTRQHELDQLRATLSVAALTLRKQLQEVERSAAWRYGHAVTRRFSRLRGRRPRTAGGVVAAIGQVDRILQLLGAGAPAPADEEDAAEPDRPDLVQATREDELLLGQRVREALGPPPALENPPSVAIIVVSRSRARVSGLLQEICKSSYPALELILIDNASPGQQVAALAAGEASSWAVAVRAEYLDSPASFAQANNRGAELAHSELLLFLNDDIHPLEPDWLTELVSGWRAGEQRIVGASLVDPRSAATGGGWRLEQRGITIGIGHEGFTPVQRSGGEDVFGEGFGIEVPAVAVSGACMLVSKSHFEALGGFDAGYQFGLEDIDLCLRARARGDAIACSGRTILVHEGSSSQSEAGREFRRINRAVNRRRFHELWGPSLRRDRFDGLLRGDRAWGTGPHLALARTSNDPADGWGDYYTAQELGEAMQALGWRVTYLAQKGTLLPPIPADLDAAVVLTDPWDARDFPPMTLMCAWVRNWTERWLSRPWLDRYDVLLASSGRSAELLEEATGREVARFPLATNQRRFDLPPAGTARDLDWVLTANRWGEPRAIEAALPELRGAGAIYGRGWDRIRSLAKLAHGSIDYAGLPNVYRGAKVVLDDTAEPTLAYDAVNSRVFDAIACGALPLTNCERGVRELFDEEFPVWQSAEQLGEELEALLRVPEERARLVTRYRQTVLERHTYEHRAIELSRILAEHNQRLSFCLKIGAPDWEQAERWGDLYFATSLGRALRRLGHRWRIDVLPEWDSLTSSTFDVVIHLRGRSEYAPNPGQFNVLWLISHPDTFDPALAAGFDLVCVASAPFGEQLAARIQTPVRVLEQATDPRVFYPDADPAFAHELVFVGNSRGVQRKILNDLLPTDRDLAVWGGGWDGSSVEPYVRAEHVPNAELRKLYSSAAIVLCDHWPDMREAGFRSNRIYDALACGGLVLSDRVAGLDGSFGDAVVTYEDPTELRELIDRLLDNPEERSRRATGGPQRIAAGETFDDRARQLVGWVTNALERRSAGDAPAADLAGRVD